MKLLEELSTNAHSNGQISLDLRCW